MLALGNRGGKGVFIGRRFLCKTPKSLLGWEVVTSLLPLQVGK